MSATITRLTGAELLRLVETEAEEVRVIVEDFLHEGEVMMLAADPGAGKSVIALQMIMNLSAGEKLFGELEIERPQRVYYFQLEGSTPEFMSRIRRMKDACKFQADNIVWDTLKLMNVLDKKQVNQIIAGMKEYGPLDVVIIDPIYKAVVGALKEEEPAKAIIAFSDLLKDTFNCAVVMIHHTHRTKYARDGAAIDEDDPFFGSQWLKAHIDIGYHFKRVANSSTRSTLICKKDRNSKVRKLISLSFDPEFFTIALERNKGELTAYEKVLEYIRRVWKKEQITHGKIVDELKIPSATLKRVQQQMLDNGIIRCDKRGEDGRTKIWELVDE